MWLSTVAYRVYAFSTLTFLAQLDEPPSGWPQLQARALQSLYPGPRGWAPPAALHGLPQLGFPGSLPDLDTVALAAKHRVCHWEAAAEGGLDVAARAERLRQTRLFSTQSLARPGTWASWFDSSFLLQLDAASRGPRARGLLRSAVAAAIGSSDPAVQRARWQRTCVQLVAPDRAGPLREFLLRRLARWQCGLAAEEMVDRALATYPAVARSVPPRVLSACIRSLWNGWVTARRFQRHANCCFGCAGAEDSVEHYATCPLVAAVAASQLGLPRPGAPAAQLASFLLLEPPPSPGTATELRRRALLTASVYLTHCWWRHHPGHIPFACQNALRLILRQLL